MEHGVNFTSSLISVADYPGNRQNTVICFSHLRWDFVFQRPQHLMSRFARENRVIYWEEARFRSDLGEARLDLRICPDTGVMVAVPELVAEADRATDNAVLKAMLDAFMARENGPLIRWYYTPMMLPFSEHVPAACIVYDCMDELANFKNAPPGLGLLERRLLDQADVVFTGGYSLYEAKRDSHCNIHPFPSSVDVAHFIRAREAGAEPADQAGLPRPRFGFYGVVDERMDLALLAAIADTRPDWSIVIVGPVVKIDRSELPQRPNIHYLDAKSYGELPAYLRGWDVALMPFAVSEATRFISPTKTPEYLAGGRPVVSTPITDVVRHYSGLEAVRIASSIEDFIQQCDVALALSRSKSRWRDEVDRMLAQNSWDRTYARMAKLVREAVRENGTARRLRAQAVWPADRPRRYDCLVVGAGFAGAVMAERLAAGSGKKVLLIDRRPHIGGNAYDRLDEAGILIHQYGPHIFHTNSAEIVDYLSRFTRWRPYEHRVLASVEGKLVPMPINRTTLNAIYGLSLFSDEEAEAFLAERAEIIPTVRTSADVVMSRIGRDLYEKFFQGYTRKQWGMDPSELDKSVTSRVPARTNIDDRYFTDSFQAMPAEGFTRMFERMLDHPNIELLLGVDYHEVRSAYPHEELVFTGPIDEYFDYRFGRLPYRSLVFRHQTLDQEWFQKVAVVNYPSETVPYTRITEYKHLTGQKAPKTSISYEYPHAEGDPYYPIPCSSSRALFKRYEALTLALTNVTFVGRLATYRYYNMDQVIGQALATYRRLRSAISSRGQCKVSRHRGSFVTTTGRLALGKEPT